MMSSLKLLHSAEYCDLVTSTLDLFDPKTVLSVTLVVLNSFCDLEIAIGNAIQDRRRQTWTTIANCYANCRTICRSWLLSSRIFVFRAWFLIVLSFLSSHYHLYMLQFSQWAERCVLTVLSLILVLCYDYFTLFSFDKSVYICAFIVLITVYDMLV